MGDKIFGDIKEGLNEKKPMFEDLKENLLNIDFSTDEKELMEEAIKVINSLETTLRCAIETINVAREQRDKAYQALVKAVETQNETEEELLEAKKALVKLSTAQCFGSGEVLGMSLSKEPLGREILARMKFASEILEELEG